MVEARAPLDDPDGRPRTAIRRRNRAAREYAGLRLAKHDLQRRVIEVGARRHQPLIRSAPFVPLRPPETTVLGHRLKCRTNTFVSARARSRFSSRSQAPSAARASTAPPLRSRSPPARPEARALAAPRPGTSQYHPYVGPDRLGDGSRKKTDRDPCDPRAPQSRLSTPPDLWMDRAAPAPSSSSHAPSNAQRPRHSRNRYRYSNGGA